MLDYTCESSQRLDQSRQVAHLLSLPMRTVVFIAYDIIGDIHGHAEILTTLLAKLGYRHHLGAWRHTDRSAIFVGDFIDRGPGQLETRIVREMLDAGTARAVTGNHEFNAIAWHTPDPDYNGQHLRRRVSKNRQQHGAFLAETEDDPVLHSELVAWFLTLPLWLELPELRLIHARWDRRDDVRTRWWDAMADTYRKSAILDEPPW